MRVHGNLVLMRALNDMKMVIYLPLAIVIFVARHAVLINALDVAVIGHIAGLDDADATFLVEVERVFQLVFIIADIAGGFVVADQARANFLGVARNLFNIEIIIGFRKGEYVSIIEPVIVPTDIPAFDKDADKAIFSGEVEILFCSFCRGCVQAFNIAAAAV